MYTQLALDLRLARRKAGLLQSDCATLLGVTPPQMCRIEKGLARPNVDQIVTLSVIYGKSFETYFADVMQSARAALSERLPDLPDEVALSPRTAHRRFTLDRLRRDVLPKTEEHADL